jgi:hypothetical protein
LRRFTKGKDHPYGAVVGVLQTVLQMIENGDRYLGVATDHVVESFRNRLWADYKTGAGIAYESDLATASPSDWRNGSGWCSGGLSAGARY